MKKLKIANGENIILESNSKGIEVSHIETEGCIINKLNISNKEKGKILVILLKNLTMYMFIPLE